MNWIRAAAWKFQVWYSLRTNGLLYVDVSGIEHEASKNAVNLCSSLDSVFCIQLQDHKCRGDCVFS